MGITVDWDNPQKTIISQVYGATWDWDEYVAAFRQIDALASEVAYPVGVLADTKAIRRIPLNAIMYGSRAIRSLPSNVVLYVVISPSSLTLSIVRAIEQITRRNLRVATTIDAGRSLIEAERNNPHLKRK